MFGEEFEQPLAALAAADEAETDFAAGGGALRNGETSGRKRRETESGLGDELAAGNGG